MNVYHLRYKKNNQKPVSRIQFYCDFHPIVLFCYSAIVMKGWKLNRRVLDEFNLFG